MYLIRSITSLLFVVVLFSACNENETKTTDNSETVEKNDEAEFKAGAEKLEGAWEIVRAEGPAIKSNLGTVYTFEGDNLIMGKNGFNNPGKTVITDSTFSFQANGNEFKFLFHYNFDGDTLVTSMENSNGQRLFMLRK